MALVFQFYNTEFMAEKLRLEAEALARREAEKLRLEMEAAAAHAKKYEIVEHVLRMMEEKERVLKKTFVETNTERAEDPY